MATPAKTYPYAILYADGMYIHLELTKKEVEEIIYGIASGKNAAVVTDGVVSLQSVRSFMKQNPPPKEEPAESASPDVSPADLEWLRAQQKSWNPYFSDEDDDVDFPEGVN